MLASTDSGTIDKHSAEFYQYFEIKAKHEGYFTNMGEFLGKASGLA